jgi:site-specific DNA-methyltransferase (adenine-specific)
MERRGLCSDLNPLAVLISGAKVGPPSWKALSERLDGIAQQLEPLSAEAEPPIIHTVFSSTTLGELMWLRKHLDRRDRTDRFLLAATAGILHLNADASGRPRGLTVSMPNTFSMSPNYVQRYVAEHGLKPPNVHVITALRERLERLRPCLALPVQGRCWTENASAGDSRHWRGRARLVVTSPPYLHVMKYGKLNWLRLWLLNEAPPEVDSLLLSTQSLDRYSDFMSRVLVQLSSRLEPDGCMCLVIGDVAESDKTVKLAEHVARCASEVGLRHLATLVDDLPHIHKVSRIWGERKGRATRRDRVLVLGGPEAARLPPFPSISWSD